ncbi:MAG: cytochrome c peroxidase [Bacteroidota bacterium]
MRKIALVSSLMILMVVACTKDKMPVLVELDNQLRNLVAATSPTGNLDFYVLPDEDDFENIPADPKNPLTQVKVNLGKFMFYDTGLAVDAVRPEGIGTYSCATCHIPEAGFKPGSFQGIADGGSAFGINGENRVMNPIYDESELDVQDARALSLVNVAYVTNTFWNGQFGATGANIGTEDVWADHPATERNNQGFEGIETQNFDGLVAHRIAMTEELAIKYGYKEMFDEAFPEISEEERYTTRTASLAFSAYIRTILSNKAPFQHWLRGNEDALDYSSKKGAILFFSKANCATCHYNQNLGSPEFHSLGVYDMYQQPSYSTEEDDFRNFGRGGFTKKEEDNYKFKVPGIYNNADADFFFHGASVEKIEDLIEYFDKAIPENDKVPAEQISTKFKPLNLTEEEKSDLVQFLKVGLRDPNLIRYQPTSVPSGFCFPNADQQSKIDLGCE